MLFYCANSGKFVLGLGDHMTPVTDMAEFDLTSGEWQKTAPPTIDGKPLFSQEGRGAMLFFQHAYAPELNKVFVYAWNRLCSYDPASHGWSELKAEPSPANHEGSYLQGNPGGPNSKNNVFWSSMCWDPINKEVLLHSGRSAELGGTPGTWAYTPVNNAWRKLEFGTKEEKETLAKAATSVRSVWSLLSAARSRYFITETEAEAKVDLAAKADQVLTAIAKLRGEVNKYVRAAQTLDDAASELKKATAGLHSKLTSELLLSLNHVHRLTETAMRELAVEPPPRMDAQMAFDVASKKIVLFGGDGSDRIYADTWVYDCTTSKWEQRYPQIAPPPRAGAALLYLPRSGNILLAGGYTCGYTNFRDGHIPMGQYDPVADLWIYDVAANRWSLLGQAELQKGSSYSPVSHGVYDAPAAWVAAANQDDTVVVFGSSARAKSTTWACKIDVAKTLDAGKYGVAPGVVALNQSSIMPESFEKAATPDGVAEDAFLANLPVNSWQKFKVPLVPISRYWGTSAYDPTRHQMLYWGGGHCSYHLTDVNHFSLRSGVWTTSCAPDWTRLGGFGGLGTVSFYNRPDIPTHAYHFYVYDANTDRMVFANSFSGLTLTYNVTEREWDSSVVKSPMGPRNFTQVVASTLHGVVTWAGGKLWLWDGQARTWSELPLKKKLPEQPYSDRSGMTYDVKRDCLWLSEGDAKPMLKYDFNTGEVVDLPGLPETVLGSGKGVEFHCFNIREMVYVPDQDLVYVSGCGMPLYRNGKRATTDVIFDPESGKYYWATIANSTMDRGWGTGLAYDPLYKLLLLGDSDNSGANMSVLKLDRKTAGLEEIQK